MKSFQRRCPMPKGSRDVLGIKGTHRSARIDKVVSEMSGGKAQRVEKNYQVPPKAVYTPSALELESFEFGVPLQEKGKARKSK
jgi:hypothetical protein